MLKVSIIIPVYNAEKYLKKCLNSVINQTYNNVEIICVNDGSSDSSLQILQEFERKDKRIIVVDKKNGGVSSARNAGLKVSSGEYIMFLDSDDFLDLDTVYFCIKNVMDLSVDIVRVNYKKVYHNINIKSPKYFKMDKILIYPFQNIAEQIFENDKYCSACETMIRADIAKKFCFCDDISIGEDFLYFVECLFSSKKIYISNSCKYNYVLNKNSATQKFDDDKYINAIKGLIKVVNTIELILNKHLNLVPSTEKKMNRNIKDYFDLSFQMEGMRGLERLKNKITEDRELSENLKKLNVNLDQLSEYSFKKKLKLRLKKVVKKIL